MTRQPKRPPRVVWVLLSDALAAVRATRNQHSPSSADSDAPVCEQTRESNPRPAATPGDSKVGAGRQGRRTANKQVLATAEAPGSSPDGTGSAGAIPASGAAAVRATRGQGDQKTRMSERQAVIEQLTRESLAEASIDLGPKPQPTPQPSAGKADCIICLYHGVPDSECTHGKAQQPDAGACVCASGTPESHDGPHQDCPIHGEPRAAEGAGGGPVRCYKCQAPTIERGAWVLCNCPDVLHSYAASLQEKLRAAEAALADEKRTADYLQECWHESDVKLQKAEADAVYHSGQRQKLHEKLIAAEAERDAAADVLGAICVAGSLLPNESMLRAPDHAAVHAMRAILDDRDRWHSYATDEKAWRKDAEGRAEAAESELEQARARLAELERALRDRNRKHDSDCPAVPRLDPDRVTMRGRGPCSCGYEQAQAALTAEHRPAPAAEGTRGQGE